MTKKKFYQTLYFQVLVCIAIGVFVGHFYPETGAAMKPLGDGFIKLIKMMIAPIIFCTVVMGIAGMEDMKAVGKTGGLAILYFEVVSGIALIIFSSQIRDLCGLHIAEVPADFLTDFFPRTSEIRERKRRKSVIN